MATFTSHSADETWRLGEEWGRAAKTGWVIGLRGDLGAGKTRLVQGFAAGLGLSRRVLSPTFALVNEYREGRLPLFHLDLYRLDSPEQIVAAGLELYFAPEGVTIVEWIDRWLGPEPTGGGKIGRGAWVPKNYRHVQIDFLDLTERRIIYEDFGD